MCCAFSKAENVGSVSHDRLVDPRRRALTVSLTNQQVTVHAFLQELYEDEHFPNHVVAREGPSDPAAVRADRGGAAEGPGNPLHAHRRRDRRVQSA